MTPVTNLGQARKGAFYSHYPRNLFILRSIRVCILRKWKAALVHSGCRTGAGLSLRPIGRIVAPMITDDEMAALRVRLAAHVAEIDALADASADSRKPVELDQQSVGRLSRMDAMQVQAMALAAAERRLQERKRVAAAIARIDDGSYGDCLRCGEAITDARLRADPTTPLCLDCARGGDGASG